MISSNAISLSDLATGERGTVLGVEGGVGFVGRMAALGFTPGAIVRVDRNHGHGPVLVTLLDTQIALGRGQAFRVKVRRTEETRGLANSRYDNNHETS